jgi:hypothetical protein
LVSEFGADRRFRVAGQIGGGPRGRTASVPARPWGTSARRGRPLRRSPIPYRKHFRTGCCICAIMACPRLQPQRTRRDRDVRLRSHFCTSDCKSIHRWETSLGIKSHYTLRTDSPAQYLTPRGPGRVTHE